MPQTARDKQLVDTKVIYRRVIEALRKMRTAS
jgi:hypothetical protein